VSDEIKTVEIELYGPSVVVFCPYCSPDDIDSNYMRTHQHWKPLTDEPFREKVRCKYCHREFYIEVG